LEPFATVYFAAVRSTGLCTFGMSKGTVGAIKTFEIMFSFRPNSFVGLLRGTRTPMVELFAFLAFTDVCWYFFANALVLFASVIGRFGVSDRKVPQFSPSM
jgi:hypothetical protein